MKRLVLLIALAMLVTIPAASSGSAVSDTSPINNHIPDNGLKEK
jgi:hypothetical protein